MEREVGGGIGMGNTCKHMAVSFQCMTKFTTNKKKHNCFTDLCYFLSNHDLEKINKQKPEFSGVRRPEGDALPPFAI